MRRWCDECLHWRHRVIGEADGSERFAVHTCVQSFVVVAAQAPGSKVSAVLCSDARCDDRACGPDGRYFERSPQVVAS